MAKKANKAKTHKSMSASAKGAICLALLLAVTAAVSVLGVTGMKLDSEGVNILLPWVPVSSSNWPKSLFLSRELGGGVYYEYTVSAAEGEDVQAAAEETRDTMLKRLRGIGEDDVAARVKDGGVVRVELRHMASDELQNALAVLTTPARFAASFSDGVQVLSSSDVGSVKLGYNSAGQRYELTLNLTKEGRDKLNAALEGREETSLTLTLDSETLTSTAVAGNGKVTASVGTYAANMVSNMAFFLNNGSLENTVLQSGTGEIETTGQGTLRVILIAAALLLLAALVCMVVKGKLTGLAAFWSVWCAVVAELFFFTTIVLAPFNLACAIALLAGILLAIYTADARVDAVKKQLNEGATPRQALKFGFRASAKNVWIAHAVLLVIGLILMIFRATEPFGNCLAAGVVASALAVALMRLFLYCFTMTSGKPGLFGKNK